MARKRKNKFTKPLLIGAALLIVGGAALGGGEDKTETAAAPTAAPARVVATAAPTATAIPTATPYRIHGMDPERTVYVSSSGVIHVKADCSGMKHYTEMSLETADAAGYDYCSKCIW